MTKKIVISSGGTGGHLFPSKSVANYLNNNYKNIQIIFITDKRGKQYLHDCNKKISIKTIYAYPISGKSFFYKIKSLFFIFLGFIQCLFNFIKSKPNIVVSFGGYVSIAPLLSAIILNIPIILHEQNAMPGRTTRLFAKFAKKIAISFVNTIKLDKYKSKVEYTGLPVREKFLHLRDLPRANLPKTKYNILILGGSQGAMIFGELIPRSFALLPVNIQTKLVVYHQCRNEIISKVKALWDKTNVNVKLNKFFNNVDELIFNSDLIISRAGASTISEINCIGRAALYVPYKYATDNHQEYNARSMQNSSIMILEKDFNINNLNNVILSIFKQDNKLNYISKSAKLQYNSNAIKELSNLIMKNER